MDTTYYSCLGFTAYHYSLDDKFSLCCFNITIHGTIKMGGYKQSILMDFQFYAVSIDKI